MKQNQKFQPLFQHQDLNHLNQSQKKARDQSLLQNTQFQSIRQNYDFNETSLNDQFHPIAQPDRLYRIKNNCQPHSNILTIKQNSLTFSINNNFQSPRQRRNQQTNHKILQKTFFRLWFSPHQSPRDSQCSELIEKVPKQMRSTLQKKKSIKQTIRFDNLYQGIKSAFDPSALNCSICMDTVRSQCGIASCIHKFCSECVINYLTFKIDAIEQIYCPNENCDLKVDFNSNGWNSLPKDYKQKYKKQQLWRQTIKNPDLKLCPREKCEQGTINLRKIPLTCQKCHFVFCEQCMMLAHPGKQCDQNFKENFKEWKRCPKCQIFIEKTQGCNHMKCQCKNEFCFVCLCVWEPKHYSCLEDKDSDLISGDDVSCPKMIAILMVLLLPIIVVLALVFVLLFVVVALAFGFLFCLYMLVMELPAVKWCICILIVSPIIIPIVMMAIVGWGLINYCFPVLWQYLGFYIRNIRNLWNRN